MATAYISMPDRFLKSVDSFAEKEGFSRSELIREAVRHYESSKLNGRR